ncbi:GPP34 family phosphoprotein [Catenuloplanes sp. NPDC051500]|uniref:GOLPH3/VPS74 family protein n=1 Tax=Catenuloplanes sp. NPDC051500 TaxID=3363959 RepID=UPI003794D1CF
MTSAAVRDRLFLLAHDEDHDLAPLIRPGLLDFALAGATLIDLLLNGWIQVDDGTIRLTSRTGLPGDIIGERTLLHLITRTTPRAVRDVLYEISPTMYLRTQAALIAGGTIRQYRRRFRRPAHRLNDPRATGIPRAVVRNIVLATAERKPLTPRAGTDALAALVNAVHLYPPLYLGLGDAQIRSLLNLNTRAITVRSRPGAPARAIPFIAGCVEDAVAEHAVAVYG